MMRAPLLAAVALAALCSAACTSRGGESSSSSSTSSSSSSGGGGRDAGGSSGAPDAAGSLDASVAEDAGRDAGPRPDAAVPRPEASHRESLRWRTGYAVEHHLMQALALTETEVCAELGLFKCITRPADERPFRASGSGDTPTVAMPLPHQVALGGNDPFDQGNYAPRRTPGATSPNALDRVVLAACDARVLKDKAGPAVVFAGVDLNASTLPDNAATRAAITQLFRRFHARDPLPAELTLVASLAEAPANSGPPLAEDAARAMCVAVGGMSESAFD